MYLLTGEGGYPSLVLAGGYLSPILSGGGGRYPSLVLAGGYLSPALAGGGGGGYPSPVMAGGTLVLSQLGKGVGEHPVLFWRGGYPSLILARGVPQSCPGWGRVQAVINYDLMKYSCVEVKYSDTWTLLSSLVAQLQVALQCNVSMGQVELKCSGTSFVRPHLTA